MSYENKTIEELIGLLEERDESIESLQEELQCAESSLSDANDTVDDLAIDNSILEDWREDKEEIVKKAFDAGYNTIKKPMNDLKAWLNYKIGERL